MTDTNRLPADRVIVTRFVDYLRKNGRRPELTIDRWPEEECSGQSEIECVAGDLAIEHTSVDTLPNQRRDGEWFQEALGSVENIQVAFRLRVLVPYELVKRGTDWPAFRTELFDWITNVAPGLPDGKHEVQLASTPLRLATEKDSTGRPGVFLRRPAPDDDTLHVRVGEQIRRKMTKLAKLQGQGVHDCLALRIDRSSTHEPAQDAGGGAAGCRRQTTRGAGSAVVRGGERHLVL